jgi:hypothetical protein
MTELAREGTASSAASVNASTSGATSIDSAGGMILPGVEPTQFDLHARFGLNPCDRHDQPGVALNEPVLVDFSRMPICTPDQDRIEAVLMQRDLSASDVLHVGVGNSFFARRMAVRCKSIDGITVAPAERDLAASLKLPNYRVFKANKYAVSLPAILNRFFDVIVDNNLASFACCGFHLMLMFSSYRLMLRPGGSILTDRQGMEWTASDPRFRISEEDLNALALTFGLTCQSVTDHVLSLTRPH